MDGTDIWRVGRAVSLVVGPLCGWGTISGLGAVDVYFCLLHRSRGGEQRSSSGAREGGRYLGCIRGTVAFYLSLEKRSAMLAVTISWYLFLTGWGMFLWSA